MYLWLPPASMKFFLQTAGHCFKCPTNNAKAIISNIKDKGLSLKSQSQACSAYSSTCGLSLAAISSSEMAMTDTVTYKPRLMHESCSGFCVIISLTFFLHYTNTVMLSIAPHKMWSWSSSASPQGILSPCLSLRIPWSRSHHGSTGRHLGLMGQHLGLAGLEGLMYPG